MARRQRMTFIPAMVCVLPALTYLGLAPVDDVEVIHVVLRRPIRAAAAFGVAAVGALRVEELKKASRRCRAFRRPEILHVGRQLDRPRLLGIDAPFWRSNFQKMAAPRYSSLNLLMSAYLPPRRRRGTGWPR